MAERIGLAEGEGLASHVARYGLVLPYAIGRTVLDIGTGEGYGARALESVASHVVGLDRFASDRAADITLVLGDVRALPFADATFDVVTCFEVIEHVRYQENLISEAARVLVPGGLAFFSTPHGGIERLHDRQRGATNEFHISPLRPAELRDKLSLAFADVQLLGQYESRGWLTDAARFLDVGRLHLRLPRRSPAEPSGRPEISHSPDHVRFGRLAIRSSPASVAICRVGNPESRTMTLDLMPSAGAREHPLPDSGCAQAPPSSTPARPLLLGDGWNAAEVGGLNRYFAELFDALDAAGARPTAVVLGPVMSGPSRVFAAGRATQPLPLRLWRYKQAVTRAARGAALVDAHFALNAFWPVVLSGVRRLPLVVHFQGPWAQESFRAGESSGWQIRAKKLTELAVYRRADRIVTLSNAFKMLLVQAYGVVPWRVEVMPPGVDLDRFVPGDPAAARQRLGIEEARDVVVVVRRLVSRMGLDVLLEAWALLNRVFPEALLLIAGDGPERSRLEASASRLGLAGSVRFLGRISDSALVDCYQAADLAVVPTTSLEGFGLIVLEALACGTPVIATNVGGLPEALAPLDRRLLVPAGDRDALAARIESALDGTVPVPPQEQCRRYAESFSWERVADRHRATYEEALRPSHAKLRVVYIDHCSQLSGGELALLNMIPALTNVDAHVLLAEDGPLVARLLQEGISAEILRMPERARNLRRDRVALRRLPGRSVAESAAYVARLAYRLHRLRPDLVHTNSLKAGVYGSIAARLAGVPVVWHVRDRIATDYLPPSAVRLIVALVRRLPNAVIANSRCTMDTLRLPEVPSLGLIPAGLVHRQRRRPAAVVYDGVSIGCPPTPPRQPTRPLRVGMLGRIAPWKGQRLFLEAFAQAFPSGDVEAVLVGSALFGETDYEGELHEVAARLGITDRVDFRGFREDIAAELARLDIVAHASLTPEPFGQVVVEAMAMGRAVVAAGAGGPIEIIETGVNGLLYPPGDLSALAAALGSLAADPGLLRALGEAARDRAADFRPEVLAPETMAVYAAALGHSWPMVSPEGRSHPPMRPLRALGRWMAGRRENCSPGGDAPRAA